MKLYAILINSSGCKLDEVEGTEGDKSEIETRVASWLTTIQPGDKIVFSDHE